MTTQDILDYLRDYCRGESGYPHDYIANSIDTWLDSKLADAMPKIVAAVRRDEIGVGCGSAGNYKPCVCGSGDTVVGFVTNRDGSVKSYVCPQCAPWMKGGDE